MSRAFSPGHGRRKSILPRIRKSPSGRGTAPSGRRRVLPGKCSGNEQEDAKAIARLSRRQTLTLGLGGILLPSPFIGGRRAMAQNTPDTVVYVSNAASKEIYVLAM